MSYSLHIIPLLPLLGATFLFFFGRSLRRDWVHIVATLAIAGSCLASLDAFFTALPGVREAGGLTETVWTWMVSGDLKVDLAFRMDALSGVMCLVITFIGTLIHVYSTGYMAHEKDHARFFSYLNLFCAAMLLLVLGDSLPVMFVGWEGVGLCSYLLIGFWYRETANAEAGKKAFIVNRIGDFGFLLGTFMLFGALGTLDIPAISQAARSGGGALLAPLWDGGPTIATAAAVCLFIGAAGKSAQIPLYVWLPDAMAGPTPVSALIHAATMVTAGVYMVCRMAPLYVLAPYAMLVVAIVGVTTALLAGVIGLAQNDIKKVLAYSTISQLGYMFVAAGAGAFGAAMFHVTTHAFFKALMFLASGAVIHALHGEQDMQKMGGLRRHLPRTFLCFAAGWVAITGVPLTSGFFSKDEILYKAFLSNPALWALGVVGAALTALYMTRLMALTFFSPSRMSHDTEHHIHEAPPSMLWPLVILAVLSLTGGLIGMPASWFGHSPFESWLAPVFEGPESVAAVADHGEHGPEMLLMAISSLVAIAGIGLGWFFWVTRPDLPRAIAQRAGPVYELVRDKFYVDELYELIILRPFYFTARMKARFDETVVDGAVNMVGGAMEVTGNVLKLFHNGFVRNYALIYLMGATAIFWYLLS